MALRAQATFMKTSGGREYWFGPNWRGLCVRAMAFIAARCGVHVPHDAAGNPALGAMTPFLYFIHDAEQREAMTSYNDFFPGCVTTCAASAIHLRDLAARHGCRIVISNPYHVIENLSEFVALDRAGLRVASTFEAMPQALADAWTGRPIQDYCIAWDSGVMMYTCEAGTRHFNPAMFAFDAREIASRAPLETTTSLLNRCQRFAGWKSGDVYTLSHEDSCMCGRPWIGSIASRRDAQLLLRTLPIVPGAYGIDPPPGVQVFQDSDGRVSLRYDDPVKFEVYSDAVNTIYERITDVFGACEIELGRVRRGSKIPPVYSVASRRLRGAVDEL